MRHQSARVVTKRYGTRTYLQEHVLRTEYMAYDDEYWKPSIE